jgi:hypothetical protein
MNEPRGEISTRSAPSVVAVEEQHDLIEVALEQVPLPLRERTSHQSDDAR